MLKKRIYNISHNTIPEYIEHENFVKNHPYLHWYIVNNNKPIGTFYIKSDNSIGVNIEKPSLEIVNEILQFIDYNFKPRASIPSSIPPYFYLNVASANSSLINLLKELELTQIQVSYRLK